MIRIARTKRLRLWPGAWGLQSLTTIAFGSDPTGSVRSSRFACVRVSAAHPILRDHLAARALRG